MIIALLPHALRCRTRVTIKTRPLTRGRRKGRICGDNKRRKIQSRDGRRADSADGSTLVAVLTDNDGRIIKCIIDSVQSKINFSGTGEITTDLTARVKSKLNSAKNTV